MNNNSSNSNYHNHVVAMNNLYLTLHYHSKLDLVHIKEYNNNNLHISLVLIKHNNNNNNKCNYHRKINNKNK